MELTVPLEDGLVKAQEQKKAKYTDVVAECQKNEWGSHYEPK